MDPNRMNQEPSGGRPPVQGAPRPGARPSLPPSARAARRQKRETVFRLILLLAVLAVVMMVVLIASVVSANRDGDDLEKESDKQGVESGESEDEPANPYAGYTVVATPSSKVACGSLILVNSEYVYDFTENDQSFVSFGDVRAKVNGVTPTSCSPCRLPWRKLRWTP